MRLYWTVRNANGDLLFTTVEYPDTADNRQTVGKTLRKAFPSGNGYSVTRHKART